MIVSKNNSNYFNQQLSNNKQIKKRHYIALIEEININQEFAQFQLLNNKHENF